MVPWLLLSIVFACEGGSSGAVEEVDGRGVSAIALALTNPINLYNSPNGKQTMTLSPGSPFDLTGIVSNELYFRRIGEDSLLEPYLELILPDSSRYWAYANPDDFKLAKTPQYWQWNNRLRAILSPQQHRRYQQLIEQWNTPSEHIQMLLLFQRTRQLCTELQEALSGYPLLPLSDYEDVLPACISYDADGKVAWWINYNAWHKRALSSSGAKSEEALFEFFRAKVFPPDGIEYHFPAWHFPVSSKQSHSMLGRGVHFDLLQELDQLQEQYPFVDSEWENLREHIIRDITDPEVTYWENWEALDAEIHEILSYDWSILSEDWLLQISRHRERLKQGAVSSVQFDYRNR